MQPRILHSDPIPPAPSEIPPGKREDWQKLAAWHVANGRDKATAAQTLPGVFD